jgi:aspartate/methionine/tyrosine aminotransferase
VLDAVEGRLDGLIIASPSNPTGTMIDRAGMEDLVAYCRERGVRLVSDEIYHGITYEAPAVTALEFGDDAIIINSFSKYYSMTGWRLGWMVMPEDMLRPVECLAQNLFLSPLSTVERSSTPMSPATGRTGTFLCASCRKPASTAWRRRKGRSISMRTFRG